MKERDLTTKGIKKETRRLKRKRNMHCIDWQNKIITLCGLQVNDLVPYNNFFYHAFFDTLTHDVCARCRIVLDKRKDQDNESWNRIVAARQKDQKRRPAC